MIKRSRLPYRLSIPRTNNMKRMLFYNAVKLWNKVSDNDVVRSSEIQIQLCVYSRLAALKLTEIFWFVDDIFFHNLSSLSTLVF